MRKLLLTALIGVISLSGTAQVLIDDFENTTNTWNPVACGAAIVDNPYQTGLNLSCKVLQLTRAVGCENWSGAIYTLPSQQIGYNYVHALMYRNNTGTPNVKVTDDGGNLDVAPMTTIVANQWQDVVFDISGKSVDFVMFMADRDDITADAVVLVDDVILSNDPTPRTTANTACSTGDGDDNDNNDNNNDNDTGTQSTSQVGSGTENGTYTLVWADYFDQGSLNTNAWNIETNGDGGGNNELQYYCDRGVSVADGCLVLTATKESYMGKTCTSGRITTQNKVTFTYGKIEASIKMPNTANGLWPAFWMMGNDISTVGWPACGETDIVEMGNVGGINAGTQDRFLNGASHWGTAGDDHRQYATENCTYSYSVQDNAFHLFTCIWDENKVAMYIDRDIYPDVSPYYIMTIPATTDNTAPGYYFHKPNFILLNLAVGGNFPSIWDINGITALASGSRSMYVDYVLVYQRNASITIADGATNQPSDPSDTQDNGNSGETAGVDKLNIQNVPSKFIHNGQLFIEHDGAYYDLLGNRVADRMR